MKKILALSLSLCLLLTGCGTRLDKSTRLRKWKDDTAANAVYRTAQTSFSSLGATKMSVGIVKDGRVRFFSFGGASEDTIYQIGTLTEMFTGITALDYLDMKEPVSTYLNAYPDNTLIMPDDSITGEMLASCTAGFDNFPDDIPKGSNPFYGYGNNKLYNYVARTGLLYEPGTRSNDSAVSFGLLGSIIEAKQYKAGSKITSLISSSVFQRVGMYATVLEVPDSRTAFRTVGHDANGDVTDFQNYDALASAAAFYSSTYDMALFAAACMNQVSTYDGKDPSFASLAKEAFSVHYDGEGGARGYGCRAEQTDAGTVFWQSSVLGGFGGYFAICPDTGIGVVVLCNRCTSVEDLGSSLISVLNKGE